MIMLFASVRRGGKTLGQMVKEEIGPGVGALALISVLAIMIILLAVLALVVVQALAKSPWGVFTIAMTIPVALIMGARACAAGSQCRLDHRLRSGRAGVWRLGRTIPRAFPDGAKLVSARRRNGSPGRIMIYGLAASILPVWMLLTPRDYLSTFLKLGTVAALAVAVVVLRPTLLMPSISRFIDGTGPVFAGPVFPFVCITIACGAVSGFHSLIASGTTPKMLAREVAHSRHRLRRDGHGNDGGAHGADRGVRACSRANILRSTRRARRRSGRRSFRAPDFR